MNVTLLVDGMPVPSNASEPDRGIYRLNLPVGEIRLLSGGARPKDLTGADDTRQLGVALQAMRWRRDSATVDVPLQSSAFLDGFHTVEFDGVPPRPFRWTNGNAALPIVHMPPWRGEALLELHVGFWPGSAVQTDPGRDAAVLGLFENLGENCELALAQRHYGVEQPLTLFRWAGTRYEKLLAGLNCGFVGLGDAATTGIYRTTADYRLSTPYLNFHTWAGQEQDAAGVAEIKRLGQVSLNLLRRKLLRDIATARRIFVFRTADPEFGRPRMHRLHAALRAHGRASLVCVVRRKPGQSEATAERVGEGLYIGRLTNFVGPDGPFDEWLELCSQIQALHTQGNDREANHVDA